MYTHKVLPYKHAFLDGGAHDYTYTITTKWSPGNTLKYDDYNYVLTAVRC